MQTYIVLALVGLAAGYVIYVFLRRCGLLGAPMGCCCEGGCASSGRASFDRAAKPEAERLAPLEPAKPARQGCCGCASSGGCCQDKVRSENNGQA